MQIITKEDMSVRKQELIDKMRNGALFIHPTDTIYGIGCNALNEEAVKKIRDIKERHDMPFSIIAPGKHWIRKHCESENDELFTPWMKKLPGPYTIILRIKDKECVSKETNKGLATLGVRIPKHWFSEIVEEAGVPIITTSANKVGKNGMTCLDDLDPDIKKHLDFIIYEDEKKGAPSQLINLTEPIAQVIERKQKVLL